MCQFGGCLYLVGGSEKDILKYDLKTSKWSKEKMFLTGKRYHPTTFVKDGFLYAISGEDESKIIPTGERIKLGTTGKMTVFTNDEKLRRVFSGVIFGNSEIFMIGGRTDNKEMLKSAIKVDLNNGLVMDSTKELTDPAFFAQSVLPVCGIGAIGYFSKVDTHPFIYIKFNPNEELLIW